MNPCAKYYVKCVTYVPHFPPPRDPVRDSERLGKLIKAVPEKCKLSLIRFTKTECAEPNTLH